MDRDGKVSDLLMDDVDIGFPPDDDDARLVDSEDAEAEAERCLGSILD